MNNLYSRNSRQDVFTTYTTIYCPHHLGFLTQLADGSVPDVEAGYCLGSEGNWISLEEGGEGDLAPQEAGKIK
jgi:hypothetical protein